MMKRFFALGLMWTLSTGMALGAAPEEEGPGLAAAVTPHTMRVFDERLQHGIDLIYSLQFEEADRIFKHIVETEPDNPVGYFFMAMVTWWRVLLDLDDESHDQAFFKLLERCIQVSEQRLQQDPRDFDAVMCRGGAIGFRGRLRGNRHQYLGAASDGLKGVEMLELIQQLDPTNKDILFGQGIYNYFAEVMPQKYPIVKPVMWFLPNGGREKGLQQLKEVVEEGFYTRAEAAYFLAQIYRIFEDDPNQALIYLEQLYQRYPANALFHRYLARALIEVGRWQEGVQHYQEIIRCSQAGQIGYHQRGQIEALYYLGQYAFHQNRLQDSEQAFAGIDSLSRGVDEQSVRGYLALARLYLGMVYDLQGRREAAVQVYEQVKKRSNYGQSHKLAEKYLKEPYQETP